MKKLLVLGIGTIAAFAACSALVVYVATEPVGSAPAPRGSGAVRASRPGEGPPAQAFGRPASPPPAARQAGAETWTRPPSGNFVPEDPENPYDPAAEAKKKDAIKSALQRGRAGKPPRSAEDEE